MTLAVDIAAVAGHERSIEAGDLIPGAREPGMLTSFRSSAPRLPLPDGPSTMDAATIAQRQREGGGAPSERRSADERSWKGLGRRLRQQFMLVMLPA